MFRLITEFGDFELGNCKVALACCTLSVSKHGGSAWFAFLLSTTTGVPGCFSSIFLTPKGLSRPMEKKTRCWLAVGNGEVDPCSRPYEMLNTL